MVDAPGRYVEFCKNTFPDALSLDGMKLVLDCAHGATYQVAPQVFKELGAEVVLMGAEPDGYNINRDVGSTSPAALQSRVLSEGADAGIAFDGDGDRVQCVAADGSVVDGDELLYVIANDRLQNGEAPEGVVGTLMSNLGMEQALADKGMALERARVGDRYVLELMAEKGWLLGGEASGHIICGDLTTTGDGIVAALQVVAAMARSGETLVALKSALHKLPQTLINVVVRDGFVLEEAEAVTAARQQVETALGDRGRLVLRPSGTEPLIRVMIEGAMPREPAPGGEHCGSDSAVALVWLRRRGVTGMISRPELIARFRRKVRIVHGTNHADGALARGSGLDRTHPAPARERVRHWRFFWRRRVADALWQRRKWQCADAHDGVAVGCLLYQQFRFGCHR